MTIKEKWMNENFCTWDEKVRIELTPQFIELTCTHENLQNTVTAPHYQIGRIDALGRVIMPERTSDPVAIVKNRRGSIAEGETMTCVDWREKHKPKSWKIYKRIPLLDDAGKERLNKEGAVRLTYIEVGDELDKDKALKIASKIAGEM